MLKFLDQYLEVILISILFSIMIVSTFSQIILRALFNDSISWSEELTRYCFILMVFFGISYAVKLNKHIKIDLIMNILNDKKKKILEIFSTIIFMLFTLYLTFYGAGVAQKMFSLGQTSPALHIPVGFLYSIIPLGLGLTTIRLLQKLFGDFKSFRLDK
ncbi:TRAP transporter small permease [Planococcus beigongshangi]|uniref:TRAP transporter small permease n=1 Tax=Planococcus beigongshangi TaxID=2782536 RepID=UPI0032C43A6A